MSTNVFGVVNGISTFLPVVKQTPGPAAIVITGSKQGITNPPGNPAYNASKAAVKILAEHLSWDLRAETNISVHLLVPGWTFTALGGGAGKTRDEKPAGAWFPEQVVDYLIEKMDQGQFYVLCPDNDVSEDTDRRRMYWGVGDMLQGRPPLTRWREDWKGKAQEGMAQLNP
jgi:NAD(P)-dependent dehydrogenase (short-subunit alcohol dehydrogenase family)